MSLLRCTNKGWKAVARHSRRGVWMRETPTTFEICAGREGDDEYVLLELGSVVDGKTIAKLHSILEYSEYAKELARDDRNRARRIRRR